MARGRKKEPCRDIRSEKIRASEAIKFLGLEGKSGERFFYRLCEEGYISSSGAGVYLLGDLISGFLWACADKRLSITQFLLGLSEVREINSEDIDAVQRQALKRENVQRLHIL